jgi:hypothetical protein
MLNVLPITGLTYGLLDTGIGPVPYLKHGLLVGQLQNEAIGMAVFKVDLFASYQ